MEKRKRTPAALIALFVSGFMGLGCGSGTGLRLNGHDGGQADSSVDASPRVVRDAYWRDDGRTASRTDAKATCQPTCEIYCANGNVLDENGCPTCTCKPDARCLITDCIPMDCPYGQLLTADGCLLCVCASAPCRDHVSPADCSLNGACRWLEPGCGSPALAAGCYSLAEMNCVLGLPCPTGKTCQKRVIDPCGGRSDCNACGQTVSFCL